MIVEQSPEAKIAFAMICHERLGEASPGARLEDNMVRMIVEATLEENNTVRAMQPAECFEMLPAQGGWAPRYVAIDGRGNIVVSDYDNHQLLVFSGKDGSLLQRVGTAGSGDGQLNMPLGVAITREGQYVVADSRNHRVMVFESDGSFVRSIGSRGEAEGELQFPMGVAVDHAGDITVADWGNNRIQVVLFFLAADMWAVSHPGMLRGTRLALTAGQCQNRKHRYLTVWGDFCGRLDAWAKTRESSRAPRCVWWWFGVGGCEHGDSVPMCWCRGLVCRHTHTYTHTCTHAHKHAHTLAS